MENIYPHNSRAIAKVKKDLRTNQRAAVVHATGTGKSIIIAEVAKDYNSVLIVLPNHYIRQQLETKNIGAEYITYTKLAKTEKFEYDRYDMIVTDEFHRAGAPIWRTGVEKIIRANPHAKILGTTATEIRYLDGQRNMATELFNDNVVSRISLEDAWTEEILPVPVYISCLYTFDKTYEKYNKILEKNKSVLKERYYEAKEILEEGKLKWETSEGIPQILKRHLPKSTRKIIVFCSTVNELDTLKESFTKWMNEAGFKTSNYVVNYKNTQSLKEMQRFRNDITNNDTVQVIFSVNMLNEGIHVPEVDAVVFLRSTISKNVFLQQLGRSMDAGYTGRPIVFDMVDNLSVTEIINELKINFKNRQKEEKKKNKTIVINDFEVISYIKEYQEVVDKIKNFQINHQSYKERLTLIEKFIKIYGWPKSKTPEYNFLTNYKDKPEIKRLWEKYALKNELTYEKRLPLIKKYVEIYGWPKSKTPEYIFLKKNKDKPEIKELWKKYARKRGLSYEERLPIIKEYIEKHGWPKRKTSEYSFLTNCKNKPEVKKLWEKYIQKKDLKYKERLPLIKKFVETYSWPKSRTPEYYFLIDNKDKPEVKELWKKYAPKKSLTYEERLPLIKKFIEIYGWPKGNTTEYCFLKYYKNKPEVKLLWKKYAPSKNKHKK